MDHGPGTSRGPADQQTRGDYNGISRNLRPNPDILYIEQYPDQNLPVQLIYTLTKPLSSIKSAIKEPTALYFRIVNVVTGITA